jgi:hypothetical protein
MCDAFRIAREPGCALKPAPLPPITHNATPPLIAGTHSNSGTETQGLCESP